MATSDTSRPDKGSGCVHTLDPSPAARSFLALASEIARQLEDNSGAMALDSVLRRYLEWSRSTKVDDVPPVWLALSLITDHGPQNGFGPMPPSTVPIIDACCELLAGIHVGIGEADSCGYWAHGRVRKIGSSIERLGELFPAFNAETSVIDDA